MLFLGHVCPREVTKGSPAEEITSILGEEAGEALPRAPQCGLTPEERGKCLWKGRGWTLHHAGQRLPVAQWLLRPFPFPFPPSRWEAPVGSPLRHAPSALNRTQGKPGGDKGPNDVASPAIARRSIFFGYGYFLLF